MMFRIPHLAKSLNYRINADKNSQKFEDYTRLIESKGESWQKLVKPADLYIEDCFNDVKKKLCDVPGAVPVNTENESLPNANCFISMNNENIDIIIKKSIVFEPVLLIEYKPKFVWRQPVPQYLMQILDDYKASQIIKK